MSTPCNTASPWLQSSATAPLEAEPAEQQASRGQSGQTGKWRMLNAFVNGSMRQLEPSQATVWLVLFNYWQNGSVTTAQSRIASLTGLSISTVEKAVKALKGLGLVWVIRRGNNLNGEASTYGLRGTIRTAPHG